MGRVLRSCMSGTPMLVVAALVASLALGAAQVDSAHAQTATVGEVNERLGLGVNLGNALEGPREGDWGLTLHERFFPLIAEAGFGHVRVPIRFSGYAAEHPPYEIPDGIDPSVPHADNLWQRIDWVIQNAEANGLYVILDLHLYDELSSDIAGQQDRFVAIWRQVAERYATASPWVLFELLNEPNDQFNNDPAALNTLLAETIAVVRESNPTRPILVGPAFWNGIDALNELELPDDPNLIVTVHFYDPFPFTHQGASWIDPVPPLPVTFDADLVGFGAGWGNWSWSTAATATDAGLAVTFGRQWAGLSFGRSAFLDPASLSVTVSGSAELSVRCRSDHGEPIEQQRITTTASPATFTIDMSGCPDATESISFMTVTDDADSLLFSAGELCETGGRCTLLIESGTQAINTAFDAAAAWGIANNRPMHVGEFGAYSAGGVVDLSERAEWTQIVREAGRSRGFSMSYWEFGAGFGVYDLDTDSWVAPLLQALGVQPVTVGDGYVALAPERLLDTRIASQIGQYSSPWGPDQTRTLDIADAVASVPTDASAVALHITTVEPTGATMASQSWLNAYPSGSNVSAAAVHNFGTGSSSSPLVNDLVIVGLGSDGAIELSNRSGHVDLVVDVVGYFARATSRYVPKEGAVRIVDTRPGHQVGPFDSPWGMQTRSVSVAGNGLPVPPSATAVAAHITTINPAGDTMAPSSWLTVGPSGAATSTSSVHNFGTSAALRQLSNDLTVIKIGADGAIDLTNAHGEVDLVIDIVGYFANNPAGSSYLARSPQRVLDTRSGDTTAGPGQVLVIRDPLMTGCSAVALHITSVAPAEQTIAELSWLSPISAAAPTAIHTFGSGGVSDEIVNDIVFGTVTGTGANSGVAVTNAWGHVDLVVDLVGLFDESFAPAQTCTE